LRGLVHVVDDDAPFRTAIERLLKKEGYNVAVYPLAKDLLDHLPDESEPGCILLDVRIPGLSGPELQDRLSELCDGGLRDRDRPYFLLDDPTGGAVVSEGRNGQRENRD